MSVDVRADAKEAKRLVRNHRGPVFVSVVLPNDYHSMQAPKSKVYPYIDAIAQDEEFPYIHVFSVGAWLYVGPSWTHEDEGEHQS